MAKLRLQELNRALGDLPDNAPFLSVMPTLDGDFVIETQSWDNSQELFDRAIAALNEKFVFTTEDLYAGCTKRITVTARKGN
jgi:hypothetical protein